LKSNSPDAHAADGLFFNFGLSLVSRQVIASYTVINRMGIRPGPAKLEGIMMAWDVAAYGITVAVLMIAGACVIGIVKICRSLTRLDLTVERLSRETEASLIQCRQLAEETKEAIVISRHSLQGFSTLAEGAGALGEAAQIAAQTAAHAVAFCRERLASFIPSAPKHRDQTVSEQPD
jgi:hypothetical protein